MSRPTRMTLLLLALISPLAFAGAWLSVARASRTIPSHVASIGWELVTWEGVTTTFAVYRQNFIYGSQPLSVTDIREGITYSDLQSYEIRSLDVYRPAAGVNLLQSRPVVFFVHGGAWTDGYRFWYDFVAQSFSGEKGWMTVVVDYRLTSDDVFIADEFCPDRETCILPSSVASRTKAAWYPDNIADVAAAFGWTVDHIGEHGGDARNIFVFGHSAGGHLASLLATHPDYAALRPQMRGIISLSGAYMLKDLDMFIFGGDIDQTFLGGHINNDDELDEASPGFYVQSGELLPSFFLIHCQFDLPSLPSQAVSFWGKLNLAGMDVEEAYLVGYSHVSEMTAISDTQAAPTIAILNYIESRLRYDLYLPVVIYNH